MNTNFDEIFMSVTGSYPSVATEENQISVEQTDSKTENSENDSEFNADVWKKEQEEIRNTVYGYLEEITYALQRNEIDMRQYLDVQAKFMEYSVSNALLILAQNAHAQKLCSAKFWRESGAKLNSNPEHIYILEKGTAYQKRDGSIATSYTPQKMFDISQTNVKVNETKPTYSQRTLLRGLIKGYPYKMTVVDHLSLPVVVTDSKDILYRKQMEFEEGFTWLSFVMAAMAMEQNDHEKLLYKAWCAAYLLCKKLGLEFKADIDWNQNSPLAKAENPKEFRNELKEIKNTALRLYYKILAVSTEETE